MTAVDRYAWEIALRDSGTGDAFFLVAMLTLRTRLDADGYAFPSMELWARDSRMSVRKLRDVVADAVRTGWLEVVLAGRSGHGWRRHGYYIRTPERAAPGASPSSEVRHNVHHVAAETCGTPDTRCGTPRHNVRHTVPTNQDINQDNNQDSVFFDELNSLNLPIAMWKHWLEIREEHRLPCTESALHEELTPLSWEPREKQIAMLQEAVSHQRATFLAPRKSHAKVRGNQ